jgi:hypothetical protein
MEGVAKVYLTRAEKFPNDAIWYVFTGLFVTAYFLNNRWNCFSRRTK